MKDIFNLENQYQLYLKRIKLNEFEMMPIQKDQLRQTFIGACGQMLLLLRDELSEFHKDRLAEILEEFASQTEKEALRDELIKFEKYICDYDQVKFTTDDEKFIDDYLNSIK
jgi:hypothetical protein